MKRETSAFQAEVVHLIFREYIPECGSIPTKYVAYAYLNKSLAEQKLKIVVEAANNSEWWSLESVPIEL